MTNKSELTGQVFYEDGTDKRGSYNDTMRIKESAQRIYNEPAYKKITALLEDTQKNEIVKHFTVDPGHSFAAIEFSKGVVYGISLFEEQLLALKDMGEKQ